MKVRANLRRAPGNLQKRVLPSLVVTSTRPSLMGQASPDDNCTSLGADTDNGRLRRTSR